MFPIKNKSHSKEGFTVLELLVLIFVVAVLIVTLIPVSGSVALKAPVTKALSNARQIALCCNQFAGDYDGHYPSNLLDAEGKVTAIAPSTANDALGQLYPDYVPDKKSFWLAQDKAYCSASPPESCEKRLGAGENHWGYVINLTVKSNPRFPLIADGASLGGTHYSTNEDTAGGTWKGVRAIVIRVDGSGSIERVNKRDLIVPGPTADVPNLLQAGQKNWLGANNWFLNPIPKAL